MVSPTLMKNNQQGLPHNSQTFSLVLMALTQFPVAHSIVSYPAPLQGSGYETTHNTASNRKLGGDLGTETKDLNFTASCKRKVWVAPPLLEIAVLNPGFRTGFFLGGWENVDACKGCMRASVHPLDFNELWTYLRTRNIRSSYNTVSMLLRQLRHQISGGGKTLTGGEILVSPPSPHLCMKPCNLSTINGSLYSLMYAFHFDHSCKLAI